MIFCRVPILGQGHTEDGKFILELLVVLLRSPLKQFLLNKQIIIAVIKVLPMHTDYEHDAICDIAYMRYIILHVWRNVLETDMRHFGFWFLDPRTAVIAFLDC